MKESTPNKTAQIEALINGEAYHLTIRYAGRDNSGSPRYTEIFSVTKNEVETYLKKHYSLNNLPFVFSSFGSQDGFYITKVDNGYQVYMQERGIRFEGGLNVSRGEPIVYSATEAWRLVVDHILRTSGT